MELNSYPLVMEFFKAEMKRRKLAYSQVAKGVGIPESTLKKWLTAEEGSLKRIEVLCGYLTLSVAAVFQEIENKEVATFRMSEKQQEYFQTNRTGFEVYWLLVYERKDVAAIEKLVRIDEKKIRQILFRLDRLGLIELSVGDTIEVPRSRPVRWSPDGKFMRGLYREWGTQILKDCLDDREDNRLVLQNFQLQEESASELRADLKALEEKYARRTIREMGAGKTLTQMRCLMGLAVGSFVKR